MVSIGRERPKQKRERETMKLRIKQGAGLIAAGITLGLALTGYETLTEMYPQGGKIVGLIVLACIAAGLLDTSTGRHKKGGK